MFADTKQTRSRDDPWREDEEADAADELDRHDDEQDNLAAVRGLLAAVGITSLIWLLFIFLARLI